MSNRKKKRGKGLNVVITICVIIFILLIISAVFIIKLFGGYSVSDLLSALDGRSETIQSPPDEKQDDNDSDQHIDYFIDDNGKYVPDYENVDENEYDPALFYTESDRIYYDSDSARYGIDISSYQKDVDWEQVAANGIDYAIIRVAYRGYGEGTLNEDDYFRQNAEGALNAGLDIGVYIFSQAVSEEEAVEEAEFVLSAIADYDVKYPIFFDWEPILNDTARTDSVISRQITDFAVAFCERIEQSGHDGAVYFNKSQGYMEYDLERISEYDFWLADYDDIPDFYYNFNIWQYTNQGTVSGITGSVDLNISFKAYAD